MTLFRRATLLIGMVAAMANAGAQQIEVFGGGAGVTLPGEDVIHDALLEATGVDVQLQFGAGDDQATQLGLRLAGGDAPEMFTVTRSTMQQFANQGLLLDLTPYLEGELAPTAQFIGEESILKGTLGDKVYAISKIPTLQYNTYWIRQDWLDALGLEPPTTTEEFLEVARAFTEDDPDGNGQKDTYGLTGVGEGLGAFVPLFGAFGVGTPSSFYMEDGQLIDALHDPQMPDALSFLNQLWTSGYVDPDLFSLDYEASREAAFQGRAGIFYTDWPNITKEEFVAQYKAANGNASWVQLAPPEGPGGQFDAPNDLGFSPGLYALPRSLENDPETLSAIFKVLNYVSSEEGNRLVMYGIEGEDYTLNSDEVKATPLLAERGGYYWVYQFTGRPEEEYLKTKFAPQTAAIEFAANVPRMDIYNGFIVQPSTYNAADTGRYIEEELVKFVTGENSIENYAEFTATLDGAFNYAAYTQAAQEQINALGLE
jgi:putative aldouronate transport system substrate-binding protein